MADRSLTKHGFPRGYRFVPLDLELISLLSDQIHAHGGGELPPPHDTIFHNLQILSYHPDELYEMYREDAEGKYIYFFSCREYQKQGGATPEDKEQKEPRPVRAAKGGVWKPSGSAKMLWWPRKHGGFLAGRKVTLVFYHPNGDKTNWGMHEFLVPVDTRITSLSPNQKYPRFHDLALYRLYILRGSDMETDNVAGSSSSQMMANAHGHLSASTAVVPPCLHMPQQLLHPSAEHAHYYHQHSAFGATSAGVATQQLAHSMPVHGAGLPAADTCQFASPSMPPAAANPAAHQAPATAAEGAGQEAGHFGDTRSPCSCSSPVAIGSPPVEQHGTATTTEPAHDQSADCVKTEEEEAAAPPPEPAAEIDYDGPGMPDWNLGLSPLNDPSLACTMADIFDIDDGASLGCY